MFSKGDTVGAEEFIEMTLPSRNNMSGTIVSFVVVDPYMFSLWD